MYSAVSEDLAHLENEFCVAIVADGAADLHGSKQSVHNESSRHISRKVRRFRTIWQLIRFANLEHRQEIDGAAQ